MPSDREGGFEYFCPLFFFPFASEGDWTRLLIVHGLRALRGFRLSRASMDEREWPPEIDNFFFTYETQARAAA